MIKILNTDIMLKEEIMNNENVILYFFADWCSPCKRLSPIIEKVLKNDTNIQVIKINAEEYPEVGEFYEIQTVPTLILIKNHIQVGGNSLIRNEIELKGIIEENFNYKL